jgi:hypothetical protein
MTDEFRNPIIKFFSSIPTILSIFILSRFCILIYSMLHPTQYQTMTYYVTLIIAIALYCFFSYLIFKHNKIAIWIMVIVLASYGLLSFIVSLVFVTLSQYILKPLGIINGVYLMYGAFILYSFIKSPAKKDLIDQQEA